MKTLIIISAFLAVSTTNLFAQKNSALEVLNLENGVLKNENNLFKIISHEDSDINLTFNLNEFDTYMVLVYNKKNKIVCQKTINKKGKNKVYFTADDNQEYTVKLINKTDIQMIASTRDNNY